MFKRATDIALAMETATRNAAMLQGAGAGGDNGELAVHQVQPRPPPPHPTGLLLHQRMELPPVWAGGSFCLQV